MAYESGLRIERESGPRFPFSHVHHLNRVPRTAFEEGSVRTFAGAELAADAQIGIDFDSAVCIVVGIVHPEHASIDRTVFHSCGRAGTTGAIVQYHREN